MEIPEIAITEGTEVNPILSRVVNYLAAQCSQVSTNGGVKKRRREKREREEEKLGSSKREKSGLKAFPRPVTDK